MKNYSIVEYGSSTREDFDKYSDRDLLIVSENYNDLKKMRAEYEGLGFSVSAYTYSKLNYMSENGSLFIDHLIKESKTLLDVGNKFSIILNNHKTTKPNLEKFIENQKYFEFLKFIPNSNKGYGWFCDCLYVGIRNYLILRSAANNNFNFSYPALLKELKQDLLLTNHEIEILLELRVIKRNYREKINDELPSKTFIRKAIKIVQKLSLLKRTVFLSKEDFQNFVLASTKSVEYNHYQKLRLIEMYYHLNYKENIEIEKIICNPQFYASFFKKQKYILNIIEKINNDLINIPSMNSELSLLDVNIKH